MKKLVLSSIFYCISACLSLYAQEEVNLLDGNYYSENNPGTFIQICDKQFIYQSDMCPMEQKIPRDTAAICSLKRSEGCFYEINSELPKITNVKVNYLHNSNLENKVKISIKIPAEGDYEARISPMATDGVMFTYDICETLKFRISNGYGEGFIKQEDLKQFEKCLIIINPLHPMIDYDLVSCRGLYYLPFVAWIEVDKNDISLSVPEITDDLFEKDTI